MTQGSDRVTEGREAGFILARLRPLLAKQREQAMTALIMHQRAETLTEGIMRGYVAKLEALDTLQHDLEQRIQLGQKDREAMERHDERIDAHREL